MTAPLRIGTRESQLAVWQATQVQQLLAQAGTASQLVYIKSEGDVDTVTPLYQMGVQGIFTKTLDAALLNKRIDVAVHSMKDVPTLLAEGIVQAAVLERASFKDIFVYKHEANFLKNPCSVATIATSSIRRKAQWLHRYPQHVFENLRGNVNTRLRKIGEHHWAGAIFAAAGLERIGLRPQNSVDLDWMLPAPAQGAIMVVCRAGDEAALQSCQSLNHVHTALCAKIERDFLRTLLGGCSTPISAVATVAADEILLQGNICSTDGSELESIEERRPLAESETLGLRAANHLLQRPLAQQIMNNIRHAKN